MELPKEPSQAKLKDLPYEKLDMNDQLPNDNEAIVNTLKRSNKNFHNLKISMFIFLSFTANEFEIPINFTNSYVNDQFLAFSKKKLIFFSRFYFNKTGLKSEMNAWKLEKNKILAISNKKTGFFPYFCKLISPLPPKNNIIQMNIVINRQKFNKSLIFQLIKGVNFSLIFVKLNYFLPGIRVFHDFYKEFSFVFIGIWQEDFFEFI